MNEYIEINYSKGKIDERKIIREEFSNPFGVFWMNIISESDKPLLYKELIEKCKNG